MTPPRPWEVKYAVSRHRAGSPLCKNTCGQGEVPIGIEQDTAEEALRSGWPGVTEIHRMKTDSVEDIIAADGSHIVCFGHEYDEYGSVSWENAELIVAAVNAFQR